MVRARCLFLVVLLSFLPWSANPAYWLAAHRLHIGRRRGVVTLSVLAVYIFRRKMPDTPRPYKMWGYPYTLWAFIAISAWFIVNALVTQPRPSLMALVFVGTGVAAYRIWRKQPSISETPCVRDPAICSQKRRPRVKS